MLSIATGELIKSANGIFCRTINTIKGIASHASRKISTNREAYFLYRFINHNLTLFLTLSSMMCGVQLLEVIVNYLYLSIMSLYQLILTYGKNKGESVMWDTVQLISDKLDDILTEEEHMKLLKKVYCKVSGGHYNDMFAKEQVSHMHFTDKSGIKHQGPFIPEPEATMLYDKVRTQIGNYNLYDFYVTLLMIYSDNYNMLVDWFGNMPNDDLVNKITAMAVNWLNDDDNPYGSEKIWGYFNK